jgi:hypothetical protein
MITQLSLLGCKVGWYAVTPRLPHPLAFITASVLGTCTLVQGVKYVLQVSYLGASWGRACLDRRDY